MELPPITDLPRMPSPVYLVQLGVTHLAGDRLLTGSRAAIADVTQGIDPALRAPYDKWHMGGHLGEIGKTSLEMQPGSAPTVEDEVQAVHRGAVMMTVLGVADAVAGEARSDRTDSNSLIFLNRVQQALVTGKMPDDHRHGPRLQNDAFAVAVRARRFLHLDGGQRDAIGLMLSGWTNEWLQQLGAGEKPAGRDPQSLLRIAQQLGVYSIDMARVAVLGADIEGHPAVRALGAIGGLEEHSSYPFSAARRGIHTYQTDAVQRHGARDGLGIAEDMRVRAEVEQYDAMQPSLGSGRERRVARTVTWFATKVGDLQRRRQGLHRPEVQEHLQAQVAAMGRH